MKNYKLYYLISLALFSIAIISAVINSYVNYNIVASKFISLGYPAYLIEVLGVAQILGLVIIFTRRSKWMVEWAYSGFFTNLILGIIAHLLVKDGNGAMAVFCLTLLLVNYILYKRKNVEHKKYIKKVKEKVQLRKVV
ncbi:DoxX family protein [Cellulophaga baltica]|uniref:DoxX family protein n=1 Tax=Cellulophaga TaxID=104264 RepID=UPI001C065B4A|nr:MULTISPECIES: DoxX family protein [Cellulophaga]MBU2996698.1 DoxX family protein [Cellulophaga baltica]MDO6768092.1 DoxX family protein [Cellulophaga sp. 1_MG-2023]